MRRSRARGRLRTKQYGGDAFASPPVDRCHLRHLPLHWSLAFPYVGKSHWKKLYLKFLSLGFCRVVFGSRHFFEVEPQNKFREISESEAASFGSTLKRHTLPVPVMLSSKRIMDHGFLVFFGIRFNQIFGVVCACCCTRPVFQGLLSVHRSVLTCEKNGTQTFFFLCLFPFWKCFLWFRVPTGDPFVLFDAERLQGTGSFFPTDIRFFCFQMVQMLFLYKATEKAIQSFFSCPSLQVQITA